jgi:bifunctional non-homologous end joining protein LigD
MKKLAQIAAGRPRSAMSKVDHTGMTEQELLDLAARLEPLAVSRMPLAKPTPRETRFGSPLELSRIHWVKSELVVEVSFSTWTADGLLRQTVYRGVREDKPASEVRA